MQGGARGGEYKVQACLKNSTAAANAILAARSPLEHAGADAAVTRIGSVCDRDHSDSPAPSRRAGPAPARR